MPRSGKEKPIMSAYIASGELGGIWGVGENKKMFCLLVYIWTKLRLSYIALRTLRTPEQGTPEHRNRI